MRASLGIVLLSVLSLTPGCGNDTTAIDSDVRDAAAVDASASDAGPVDAALVDASVDASAVDAATHDAGGDAASARDAATLDAPGADAVLTCDPARVRFVPPGGTLTVGNLCDDVFACVPSADAATALQAVAPDFVCQPTPEGPCTGVTCRYSTSTLEAAEVDEVCAVTTLSFVSDIACFVYL